MMPGPCCETPHTAVSKNPCELAYTPMPLVDQALTATPPSVVLKPQTPTMGAAPNTPNVEGDNPRTPALWNVLINQPGSSSSAWTSRQVPVLDVPAAALTYRKVRRAPAKSEFMLLVCPV